LILLLFAAAVSSTAPAPGPNVLITSPSARVAAPSSGGPCSGSATPDALVCRALEAQKRGDNAAAAQGFEDAAKASLQKDPRTARMYAAAGNLWIAANQAGKAAQDLDKALELPGLEAEQRGEALLDRARAAEAQDDLATARAKLDLAGQTISGDPFYWYFSAALAIRANDALTARNSIARALALAPNDPAILFEAGHVADFTGDEESARAYWTRAASGDPNGPIGKAAAKAVEMLGVTPTLKSEQMPPSKPPHPRS
jgi:tetratricopeptide (TPR) repeat protein